MRLILRTRIIESLLAIVLALLLVSAAESIIGVDVARTLLGTKPSQAEVVALNRELGLDRSFGERTLMRTLKGVQGDLGSSYVFRQPVTPLLISATANSLKSILPALGLGGVLGIWLGIWVAYAPTGWRIYLLTVATSIALLPSLVLSTLVVYGFGYQLNWITPSYPIAVGVLSLVPLFITAQTTEREYERILASDYTRAARSAGFAEWQVALSSIKVSAVALIANITNLFLYMLTATVFVEITFSLPGLGNLLLNAADRLDYPVITGVALLVVVCFGLTNTLSGIAIYALDPRTR
jgi:peptide/nickel transport system permease protein